MPQCVEPNWIPLQDGSNAVVLSPAAGESLDCSMVVVSGAEWAEVAASSPSSSASSPESLGVDSAGLALVFGWGFAAVIFFWFLGYCVGIAKALIQKA